MSVSQVIIVGAGPSGMLLALLLTKAGIPVKVIEESPDINENPRATHYLPPAVYELLRAGVLDDIAEQGFRPSTFSWRKLDDNFNSKIALVNLDEFSPDDPHRMVTLPLPQVLAIIKRHLDKATRGVDSVVKFGQKVTGVGQDEGRAWVDAETSQGVKRTYGDYIVGCDGGNSQVRRSLFGDLNFPGTTWDFTFVATNTRIDLAKYGYADMNSIVDPEHFHMCGRITKDGLYRITYSDKLGLSHEELRARLPAKFETILPGHPKPDQYKVERFSPYKMHQRLAEKMRVGRILLAADAAHLCNPIGGLGLTGGICDVGALYDCFVGLHTRQADDSILDKYDEIRRKVWVETTNLNSSANLKRLFTLDPNKAKEQDPHLAALDIPASQMSDELREEVRRGFNAEYLRHDMTQYFNKEVKAQNTSA